MRPHFGFRQAAPRFWLVLAILVGFAAYSYFGRSYSRAEVTAFSGGTMGTTYRVVLGTPRGKPEVELLQQAVESRLAEINARMSTYDPSSELSRFNQHRSTEPVAVSEELAHVVRMALDVSRASEGAFDVTVAPLVDAWGFGPKDRALTPPRQAEVAAVRKRVGFDKLSVEGTHLKKAEPTLEVDLSAIAKGHAVDAIAALLVARGLHDHLVEVGGEVRAQGQSSQGRPFRVGIESPDVDRRAVRLSLNLDEGALATSGNYRNFYEHDGTQIGHTLDPATGLPVAHRLLSASVWHPSCALADAWATALMVVGPERALSLAEAQGLEVLLLVAGPEGAIEERVTPGIARRRVDTDLARNQ